VSQELIVGSYADVRILTINRPGAMNAMTREIYGELTSTLRELDDDANVRAIIITGAGEKAFSAGADLKLFHTGAEEWHPWRPHRWDLGANYATPLIAAVNGYAVAGGLELALICDIRIASPNAQFGAPEVKWGLLGPIDSYWLPRAVGVSNAMRMLLTGEFIDADEALRTGLISEIVPAADLVDRALSLAQIIAQHPPKTVQMVKEMALRGLDLGFEAHLRFSEALERLAERADSQQERLSDFRSRSD
jgi:enoyl-CoA hydratase/carnithine racemase